MKKTLIFGNSGSGKSTLAQKLSVEYGLSHLDLDTLAWQPTNPPTRKPLHESKSTIEQFTNANNQWVIEGCYTDLLELVSGQATEIIFMDLPIAACIENAKSRPWEPHKYESKQAQDANLEMLINWIADYERRTDTFSRQAHFQFYQQFLGKKRRIESNQ